MRKNVRKISLHRETLWILDGLAEAAGGVTTSRWGPECISSIPCNTATQPEPV